MLSFSSILPPTSRIATLSVHENGDNPNEPVDKILENLPIQISFRDRIEKAKTELIQNPETSEILRALVDKFYLFQDADNNVDNKKNNFLSLALGLSNLANGEGIKKLLEILQIQDNIINKREVSGSNESRLAELELDLSSLSIQDSFSTFDTPFECGMRHFRISWIRELVQQWFPEESWRPINDALILLNYQMTEGTDIGPLPENIKALNFGNAKNLADFSANLRYPNSDLFKQARSEFLSKCSEYEQHFVNRKDLSSDLQGKLQGDKIERLLQALSKPVSKMSEEALVLAIMLIQETETNLDSYLKAALILMLKSDAQKHPPGLSDDTAISMALVCCDRKFMSYFERDTAFEEAADTLLKNLTPLPEDLTTLV